MDDTSEIWPSHRLHLLTFRGLLDASAIQNATRAYFAHPLFAPDQNQIVDLGHVDQFDLGFSSMMAVIRFKTPLMARLKDTTRYVLVAPNETGFGMARMYQQMTEGVYAFPIIVVRSMKAAMHEVGLDAASPRDLT